MYKRILVGIDGSDASLKASRKAADIAKKFCSELILVSIVPPPTVLLGEMLVPEVLDTSPLKEAAEHSLSQLKELLEKEHGITVRTLVSVGDPAEALVDIAEQENADLIVIGRRGLSKIERFFVGSITKKVLERSPIDVLVVI